MEDKFKETVQAMTGKEIIMAMVRGLQNPKVKIDMGSFGYYNPANKICYGCAATNTVCEIANIKFTPTTIKLDLGYQDKKLKTDFRFLEEFEFAIDDLILGYINFYNERAEKIGIALLPANDISYNLPYLTNNNYKENLQAYIDYANTLD